MDALAKIDLKDGEDYSVDIDMNFDGRMFTESNSFFQAAITRIFSTNWEKDSRSTFNVTAKEARIYALRRPKDIFKRLCELEAVRKWLQEGYLDKQKSYLVVGYRTLLNAKLVRRDHSSTKVTGQARVPVGAAAGVDPTPTGEMDVQAGVGTKQGAGGEGEFETIGERIYAICYRKVGFKFFKGVESAFLEPGNRWKSFSKTRGKAQEEEIVEADIEEKDEGRGGQSQLFVSTYGEENFVLLSSEDEDESEDEGDSDDGGDKEQVD